MSILLLETNGRRRMRRQMVDSHGRLNVFLAAGKHKFKCLNRFANVVTYSALLIFLLLETVISDNGPGLISILADSKINPAFLLASWVVWEVEYKRLEEPGACAELLPHNLGQEHDGEVETGELLEPQQPGQQVSVHVPQTLGFVQHLWADSAIV
jgi:hypothetical protein